MPVDLTDHEHAYRRALELVDEIEADTRRTLGGRLWAQRGAWTCDRGKLLRYLKRELTGHGARGRELDKMICNFLDGYSVLHFSPVPHAEQERVPIRKAALTRRHDGVDPVDEHIAEADGLLGDLATHAVADSY